MKSVTRWVAILAVPLYAIAIAIPGPLLQIYGSEYRAAADALAIMTLATLLNALARPVERALVMTGWVRLEMATNVVATVLVVGIAVVLTPRYGLNGAAASVLLYTIVRNGAKIYFVRRTTGMTTLSLSLLRPLAAAAIAAGLAAGIAQVTGLGSSPLGTLALATLIVVAYVLILARFSGMSDADRQTLMLAIRPTAAVKVPEA